MHAYCLLLSLSLFSLITRFSEKNTKFRRRENKFRKSDCLVEKTQLFCQALLFTIRWTKKSHCFPTPNQAHNSCTAVHYIHLWKSIFKCQHLLTNVKFCCTQSFQMDGQLLRRYSRRWSVKLRATILAKMECQITERICDDDFQGEFSNKRRRQCRRLAKEFISSSRGAFFRAPFILLSISCALCPHLCTVYSNKITREFTMFCLPFFLLFWGRFLLRITTWRRRGQKKRFVTQ